MTTPSLSASDGKFANLVYLGPVPSYLRRSIEQVAPIGDRLRYVYLLKGDDPRPVYIGQTYCPSQRLVQHRKTSRWWPRVTDIELWQLDLGTRASELIGEFEQAAIHDLNPIENIVRIPPRWLREPA